MGEALRRGWRARSVESSFVLQTQSRREESEREAEAMEEAETEAKREVEREREVASTTPIVSTAHVQGAYATSAPLSTCSFNRTLLTRLRDLYTLVHLTYMYLLSPTPRVHLPPLSPYPTPPTTTQPPTNHLPTTRPTTADDAPRPTMAYSTWAVNQAPSATPQQPSP